MKTAFQAARNRREDFQLSVTAASSHIALLTRNYSWRNLIYLHIQFSLHFFLARRFLEPQL